MKSKIEQLKKKMLKQLRKEGVIIENEELFYKNLVISQKEHYWKRVIEIKKMINIIKDKNIASLVDDVLSTACKYYICEDEIELTILNKKIEDDYLSIIGMVGAAANLYASLNELDDKEREKIENQLHEAILIEIRKKEKLLGVKK